MYACASPVGSGDAGGAGCAGGTGGTGGAGNVCSRDIWKSEIPILFKKKIIECKNKIFGAKQIQKVLKAKSFLTLLFFFYLNKGKPAVSTIFVKPDLRLKSTPV